jgi:succinate-acetate transporter protein
MEKQEGEDSIKIKDTTAKPAPLGLMGFGMTTVLLNLQNAGFIALGTMILSMGIFYGGIAQVTNLTNIMPVLLKELQSWHLP